MDKNPASTLPTELPDPEVDLGQASPEEIKAAIARTRDGMDEHLSQLGRKLKPTVKPAYLWVPLAGLAVGVGGYLLLRGLRHRSQPEKWQQRVKSGLDKLQSSTQVEKLAPGGALGILDQLRALKLAFSAVRKGTPSIYVVKPRK